MQSLHNCKVRLVFGFQGTSSSPPLAQLVEQLTLNQWVLGSSPRRRTMYMNAAAFYIRARGPLVKWLRQRPLTPLTSVRIRYGSPLLLRANKVVFDGLPSLTYIVGADWYEGPPVPIPNTEVKLVFVDDTCRVTGRENR